MDLNLKILVDELSAGIGRTHGATQDFTPAMRDIAGLLEFETRDRFEQGKDPEGHAWTPSQRALEEGGKTMIDSAALLSDMNGQWDSMSASIGTNLIYARIHQEGGAIRPREGSGKKALNTPFGPRGAVNMPQRAFLGFGQAEKDGVPEILRTFLANAWAGGSA